MRCDAASLLTLFTLAAVIDESLYEHVEQCLIDRNILKHVVALAWVAGVQADFCDVRLHSRSLGVWEKFKNTSASVKALQSVCVCCVCAVRCRSYHCLKNRGRELCRWGCRWRWWSRLGTLDYRWWSSRSRSVPPRNSASTRSFWHHTHFQLLWQQ